MEHEMKMHTRRESETKNFIDLVRDYIWIKTWIIQLAAMLGGIYITS